MGQHLPADEAYQMIREPNQLANLNMCSIITSASTNRVNEYHGPHREIEPTRVRERREAMESLQRATDPEVMNKQRVNMQRRLNLHHQCYLDHQRQTHREVFRSMKDPSQRIFT